LINLSSNELDEEDIFAMFSIFYVMYAQEASGKYKYRTGAKKIDAGKQKYLLCLAFGNLQRYAAWSGFCLHFFWEWERYNSIDSF
jgi:hypothetical protein